MKVFISHAAKDRQFADKLAKTLIEHGLDVSYPVSDLLPGDNWLLKAGRALDEANAMVVLLSPDAVASPGVLSEIEHAIKSPRFRGRLVPVMLRRTADYPWILKRLHIMPFEPPAIARRIRSRPKTSEIFAPARVV
jgi:hypothetical protein